MENSFTPGFFESADLCLGLLVQAYGYQQFSAASYRELANWLLPLAMQSDQGMVLAKTVLEEIRTRRIIVPPNQVVERLR